MNIRINVIKKFLPNYKSLFFFLFFSNDFIFANEDIFKPDNDIFNDEEFNTSTVKFNFIKKKMQNKNTSRIYLGAHLPIPISMGVLGKYIYDNNLNIIEDEAISTNLEERQKYIIYNEITKYNETHKDSQINDCFKIKDENLLNDYMARYKVNNEDKLAAPIYFTNLLKFATIMGKMNEYDNKNTECEFGLHGLEGEDYKNRLGETIKSLPDLAEKSFLESCLNEGQLNLDENKKKRLEEMGLVKTEGDFFGFWGDKIYPKADEIEKEIKEREDKTKEISEETKNFFKDSKYKTYNKDAISLKISHLNDLEKQQEGKKLSDHMTYGKIKPFKSLIYYNFNCGASNTLWINKRLGWEIDLSGSFSYFDLKKSVFLTNSDDGAQKLFKGKDDVGEGNVEFGLLNGHVLNQNILKRESEKKSIDEEGKYKVLDFEVKEVGSVSNNPIVNFLGRQIKSTVVNKTSAKNLYYCQENANNTRDCATNFFVTNKFILEKQLTGCFNIGCTLKQINVCLKTGIAINLSNPNSFLKNYRGKLFNNSHQLVFNVGCIANINFWNLNLNFDIDEKALEYEGKNKDNKTKYNKVKKSYESLLLFNNTKEMVRWLKEDFIQQYKFRPMFEIKYRLDSTVHVSFEVGLRFIFRSAFNFDIDKAGMRAYWENAEIPKYDNDTTAQQLQERKNRILENIDNWGIKWFYNFDMCLFFSIGFNILK